MSFPLAFAARALLCAAGLLAAFTASAQAATQPQPQPQAAAQPEERHFLWEVTSMTNRAYLFGTLHAGRREWYPLAPAIEKAFADSQVLAVEADINDLNAMAKTVDGMAYKPGDELSKHVPPADYQRLKLTLDRHGVPESRVKNLKPFTVASLLIFATWAQLGYVPEYGVDSYLLQKARKDGRKVVELEGVEEQAKIMDSLTEEEHRQMFAGTLTALEDGLTRDQLEGMVKAWQLGDAFLMLELSRRYNEKVPGAGDVEERFIWSRHEEMMAKVEGFLNKSRDRHFIAVGSLHLCGPRGLVELLKKRGYLVRQM